VLQSTLEMLPHIERICDAAHLAPSRDNLQPWRFEVDGETISFVVDPARDATRMNAGGRMARIALGAAVECALLRAGRMGASVRFHPPRPGTLVTLTVTAPKRFPEADKALVRRATNRRVYDGRPLEGETVATLRSKTPDLDGVRTLWFGRERVRVLGPIVEEGEALFYSDPLLRDAALRAVRFDVRDREEVTRGLSVGSLELSGPERLTLDSLRKTPQDRLVALAFRKMGARARRLVESASGVCVVVARGSSAETDIAVGRCMQRAWLALTRLDLAAHPMSSIAALEAIADEAEEAARNLEAAAPVDAAGSDPVTLMRASFRAAFPNVDRASRVAILMRFGTAAAPSSRVGREPVSASVNESARAAAPDAPEGSGL
jgi:hypothetical protein